VVARDGSVEVIPGRGLSRHVSIIGGGVSFELALLTPDANQPDALRFVHVRSCS
jgi:hypothetical protein